MIGFVSLAWFSPGVYSFRKHHLNRADHTRNIILHLPIPKADDFIALRF